MLLWSVPEAVSFCSPHSHLCRLVLEGSVNQDGSPRCSVKAPPPRVGCTPLLWHGRFPDVWSPKQGLPQKLSSRDLGGVSRLRAQSDQVLVPTRGTCDPGQAGFSASLMLSQVPRDWIETEVVFHSPEVLRSCGESSSDLGDVCQLCAHGDTVLTPTRRSSYHF